MPRRTISMPQRTSDLVERLRHEGESFSAAVTRLVEDGAEVAEGKRVPSYAGAADGPPLDKDDEELLAEIFAKLDPRD